MHCTPVRMPGGSVAMICGGGKRIPVCKFCGLPAGLECDFPKGKKTCDRKICRPCAVAIGPNVDFCPDHPIPTSQLTLEFASR